MSYYIAPQPKSGDWLTQELVIYRVVKRLRDFKPEDGKKYRVFSSKRHINSSYPIPIYIGKAGKLKKLKHEMIWRF